MTALHAALASALLPAPPLTWAQAGVSINAPAGHASGMAVAQADINSLLGGGLVTLSDAGGQYDLALPLAGSAQRLRTRKGADITLRITSNTSEELHLHGYDIKLKLKPGATGVMNIKAHRSGRFELETHNGHRTVLILEVMP